MLKKSKKLMKIANIDREILHIFWTTWGNSMKFSGKMCFKIILSLKKPGFHPLIRRYKLQVCLSVCDLLADIRRWRVTFFMLGQLKLKRKREKISRNFVWRKILTNKTIKYNQYSNVLGMEEFTNILCRCP